VLIAKAIWSLLQEIETLIANLVKEFRRKVLNPPDEVDEVDEVVGHVEIYGRDILLGISLD
jgi:hypothetical protein